MYIVIVGNSIVGTFKTFRSAFKEAISQQEIVHSTMPVYVAKLIVKDGVVIDK